MQIFFMKLLTHFEEDLTWDSFFISVFIRVVMGIVGFFSSGILGYGNNRCGKKLNFFLAHLKKITSIIISARHKVKHPQGSL